MFQVVFNDERRWTIVLNWRRVVSFFSEGASSFRLINKEQESKTVEEELMSWDPVHIPRDATKNWVGMAMQTAYAIMEPDWQLLACGCFLA